MDERALGGMSGVPSINVGAVLCFSFFSKVFEKCFV